MAKRIFQTTKYRFLALALSAAFLIAGIVGFVAFGGFNLGIDFQSGFSQSFQIAPAVLELTYSGDETVTLDVVESNVTLVVRSSTTGVKYHEFSTSAYPTVQDIASAISNTVSNVQANALAPQAASSSIISGFGLPATLSTIPFKLNGANTDRNDYVSINEIREVLTEASLVQIVGEEYRQIFQVRLGSDTGAGQEEIAAMVSEKLKAAFGDSNIVVLQTDFVGPKFSTTLVTSSIIAAVVAVVLILLYVWFRFKISYALAAIINLIHDILALVAFIILFQLEVSSTTIAALLTIIGYSLNNVIVIFDRIRENRKIIKDIDLLSMINVSVSQSLSRTIFSSLTTMLAVLPLAILASGSIQLFAIEMAFGVAVGAYSSNFFAPAILFWTTKRKGLPVSKASNGEKVAQFEVVNDEEEAPIEDLSVPTVERKLKGKRKEKK